MNKHLVELIRQQLQVQLQGKTGWGRIEVMSAFERAVNNAALIILDEAQKTQDEAPKKAESTPESQ